MAKIIKFFRSILIYGTLGFLLPKQNDTLCYFLGHYTNIGRSKYHQLDFSQSVSIFLITSIFSALTRETQPNTLIYKVSKNLSKWTALFRVSVSGLVNEIRLEPSPVTKILLFL